MIGADKIDQFAHSLVRRLKRQIDKATSDSKEERPSIWSAVAWRVMEHTADRQRREDDRSH